MIWSHDDKACFIRNESLLNKGIIRNESLLNRESSGDVWGVGGEGKDWIPPPSFLS